MTKYQFARINMQISSSLQEPYLGDIYDRITTNKFEIAIDEMENTYNRIQQGTFN